MTTWLIIINFRSLICLLWYTKFRGMHAARQLMACGLLSRATTAWSQMETVPDSESGFGSVRQEDSPELSPKALSELDDENKIMAGEPALNTPWTFWFDRYYKKFFFFFF